MNENEINFNGKEYVLKSTIKNLTPSKKNAKGLEYCIVRSDRAGVFAGYYDRKTKGKEGRVFNARRLWYWKGATRAMKDELFVVPFNMRDGTLICKGKGNDEWNQSAPHGAGRVLARGRAKRELSLEEFKSTMKDVWTSSVDQSTLDESPMAYKIPQLIEDAITPTCDIVDRLIPVYNLKASEKIE